MREGFEAIIERLRSGDEDVVRKALEDLQALPPPVSHEEALILLRVATEVRDIQALVWRTVGARLVSLADRLGFEQPEAIGAVYADLDEDARATALGVLSQSRPREAVEQYATLIASFGWPARGAGGSLENTHAFPDVLFPRLLDPSIPGDLAPSFRLALSYAEAGLLEADPTDALLRDVPGYLDFCEPRQQSSGVSWKWEEAYADVRSRLAIALDLLGYARREVVEPLLQRATRLSDPRLQCFAVLSLLRLGLTPDPAAIESVAQSREMRSALLRTLEKLDMAWLYPDAYRRQELIAESDLVNWLWFPTELNREPDEIELIGREDAEDPDRELFVFRFRTHPPHWAAKKGWMAGWAGPYRKGVFSTAGGGDTFSEFEPVDGP